MAVAHHNTGHPHVHIALRGVRANGDALQLDRNYVKHGIRTLAEEICTMQLGYRTERDAVEAERREISEQRFTALDRRILRASAPSDERGALVVTTKPTDPNRSQFARTREQHVAGRLVFLESMGLATAAGPNSWTVQRDLESVLRAMQRTNDRQKTLAAHGVLASDDRLPIEVLQWQKHPEGVQGRILVHGQEELSGRNYLMLEEPDAQVHYVSYSAEMESARSRGGLRTNAFVRLRRSFGLNGEPAVDVHDFGDSEAILKNRGHFAVEAQQLLKRGIIPTEDGWGGWLGRYQATLRDATSQALGRQNVAREPERQRERGMER